MIRSTVLGGALALAFGSLAAAQADLPPPPAGGPIPTSDYIKAAAQSDEFEIQEGQLAQSMATDARVKRLAAMMVRDHTKTTDNLHKAILSAGMSVPPPPPLRPDQLQMIAELRGMSPATFDRAYVDQQIPSHQQALAVQSTYSNSGDVPSLKAAATATVPIVQRHLDMARELQQSMKP